VFPASEIADYEGLEARLATTNVPIWQDIAAQSAVSSRDVLKGSADNLNARQVARAD